MATEIESPVHPKFKNLIQRKNADNLDSGPFALPQKFDTKKHAASYVLEGSDVENAKNIQPLAGTDAAAPGWAVWEGPDKKSHVVISDKKKYVLMYRSQAVQKEVNAVYEDLSKSRRNDGDEVVAADASSKTGVDRKHLVTDGDLPDKDK